jgi:peptidoglycan L-alanyl-D-glutamate endopeptidase CwlK
MPTDLLARVNFDLVYPPLVEQMFNLVGNLKDQGIHYFAISGYRSFAEQARLYFQGRTVRGPIVTNARPGQSAHNYGIAVDFCRDQYTDRDGLQPDWNLAAYEPLAREAEKLGLESALRWKSFKEAPHVQLNLAAKGLTLNQLRDAHDAGGLKEVWAYLDSKGPWF